MPENKIQHFVPRVYLRNFSSDSSRKTVCVWVPRKNKVVANAPIRTQCAAPYIYGKDLVLEKQLQTPEGWLGTLLKEISGLTNFTASQLELLKFLWLIQRNRGVVALQSLDSAMKETRRRAFTDSPQTKEFLGEEMTADEVVALAFSSSRDQLDHLDDLKCCILINNTDVPFITSDNPAVESNRFLLVRNGRRFINWGLGSSGIYLYYPLSSKLGFFAYDKNVYEVDKIESGGRRINRSDAERLNLLIMMHCQDTIYSDGSEEVLRHINRYLLPRVEEIPTERFRINLLAHHDGSPEEGFESYRSVSDSDFLEAGKGIIHWQSVPPRIAEHCTFLRFKFQKRFHDTGTGAGIIRPGSVAESQFRLGEK